jgi:DNA-binding SARP family transcriptional activator/TolB-like protein
MSNAGGGARRATLRLMGTFRLAGASGQTVAIASRRARGLLAYLALAPEHSASREKLCGLLWSDRGELQARASLRQCLLELRDLTAVAGVDFIERHREEVTLHADAFESDVGDLRLALDGADADALSRILVSLGSARLLEDLDIPGLYRDWLDQARAQQERAVAVAVLRRLESLEADGDWRNLTTLAEAYLNRDPLDEAVVAAAIRADIASGSTTIAHRRFQTLQSALARELGVPPGPMAREALALALASEARNTGATFTQPPPTAMEPIAPPPVPLVIVAMFESLASTSSSFPLAAGLRDEVLSGLSRFTDLRVLTDPRPLDVVVGDQSADRAGAYVLGATLRGSNDSPRLTVHLLTSGERRMVWSHRFTSMWADNFDEMEEIIAKVVGAVLPVILTDIARKPMGPSDKSSSARIMLALGVDARPQTFSEAQAAAAALEAMILEETTSAAPLLSLAHLYNTDFGLTRAGSSGPTERARALALAKAALAIDRSSVHARTQLGWCYLRERQWDNAKLHFEKALSLNPFHYRRLMEIEFAFVLLDEIEKACHLLDRSFSLNPADHDDYFTDLGVIAMIRGDHDLAQSYLEIGVNPEIWSAIYMAINAQMAGRPSAQKIETAVSRVAAIWPQSKRLTCEAMVGWISHHHPFRSSDVEGRFLAAAAQAFSAL